MDRLRNVAGVVLVGGRSSRMGLNKALLDYHGLPLIVHMRGILKDAGITDIYISGDIDGYDCIQDTHIFAGPAQAIKSSMCRLASHEKFLFTPVDMPLLNAEIVTSLLQGERGGYFADLPLPACIMRSDVKSSATSVKNLLKDYDVPVLPLPSAFCPLMRNTNTPQEWQEVMAL
jgi:molybdopterin-guanine dinucleotide biosynthesis protein A